MASEEYYKACERNPIKLELVEGLAMALALALSGGKWEDRTEEQRQHWRDMVTRQPR